MNSIEGIVILAQESRFQLLDGDGIGHHFTIGHACSAEPQQISDLQRTQVRVRVHYVTTKDIIGHTARRIEMLGNQFK